MVKIVENKKLKDHMKDRAKAHKFSFGDYPEAEADLLAADKRSENFIKLRSMRNGYVSPNGVFYPCEWAAHEILREYLQKLFKFEQIEAHPVDQNRHFESTFVKFSFSDGFPMNCPPIMYWGDKMTPRQKIFVSEWAKINWKKSAWIDRDGYYRINPTYIIDDKRDLRIEKSDE